MRIHRIGQVPNTNPPVFGWSIEADDNEVDDLVEGLGAYIEDLEQFEDEDHTDRIKHLKNLSRILSNAVVNGV